jgi:ADP-heptose:LPS heptosyltransferase
MQGVQVDLASGRSDRGMLSLLKEMTKHRDSVRVTLALSNLFPNTIERIAGEFTGYLPENRIRIWHAVGPIRECDEENIWRREVTERIRDAFIASLQPDSILLTGLFKGFDDDYCARTGRLCERIPLAILAEYSATDMLLNAQIGGSYAQRESYAGAIRLLDKCQAIFTVADSTSMQLPQLLSAHASKVHAIVASETGMEENAEAVVGVLRMKAGDASRYVSSWLCVEKTGIFKKRRLRILVIKLDHLGDFLLAIPAFAKLRAKYPYATIDAVVGSWNVDLAQQLSVFQNVYSFDFFKRKSSTQASVAEAALTELITRLTDYDIAIDMRRQPESRFLISKLAAGLKVGYQTLDASVDECLDIMLPTEREPAFVRTILNQTPISLQILRLVDALPANANDFVRLPELVPPAVRTGGAVAIFPKAGTDVREWGRENLIELINRLVQNDSVTTVHILLVNAREADKCHVGSAKKIQIHIGLEFSALTRVLSSVDLCIANNSGGIHLAAYLGVPTIGIYSGHETASEWGPQFHSGLVIHRDAYCSPCHLGRRSDCPNKNFCLGDIAVEDVYEKAVEILAVAADEKGPDSILRLDAVVAQTNDDGIVKALIAEVLQHLPAADQGAWIQVATAIAENHPSYRVPPESDQFRINRTIDHRSSAIEWIGFSRSERNFRWSDGDRAAILFDVYEEDEIDRDARIVLIVDTFRKQRFVMKFNGVKIFDGVRSGKRLLLDLPVENLRVGRNRLEFELPNARNPGRGDPRQLALAVRRLKVVANDAHASGIRRRAEKIREFLMRWG